MYRVVRAYTVTKDKIEFDDSVVIDIELPNVVQEINSSESINKFPGKEQFLEDVLHILEDEYHFEVIEEEDECGVVRKGHHSNRPDSISVYFDTFYDLDNAIEPMKRLGVMDLSIPQDVTVECFIHFRFSDHDLHDLSYADHRKFLADNTNKHTKDRDVLIKVDEELVTISESVLYAAYNDALDKARDTLDGRIFDWVRQARKYDKKRQSMQ